MIKIKSEGVLEIYNPLTCREELRKIRNSPYGGGLGYRQYSDVSIHNICLLWPEEMSHFLGSINSAMDYPSTLKCKIFPPVKDYKTFHDKRYLIKKFSGKGFTSVRFEDDWLVSNK